MNRTSIFLIALLPILLLAALGLHAQSIDFNATQSAKICADAQLIISAKNGPSKVALADIIAMCAAASLPSPTPTPSPTPSPAPTPSPTPAPTASPDGTSVPPATSLRDPLGVVWAFDGTAVLANGQPANGGGTLLKLCTGRVFVLGFDTQWWIAAGPPYVWTAVGTADPCGVVPSPSPSPTPSPTPSPAPVPPAPSVFALAWDAPACSTCQAGYQVLSGTQSGTYQRVDDVGLVVGVTLTGFLPGLTYYFAVRAYTAGQAVLSAVSNEVSGVAR